MKRFISLSAIIFCSIFMINAQENNTNIIQENDSVFTSVDTKAEFTGGEKAMMTFLNQNINYPIQAVEQCIQGKVFVKFIIEKDGSISNIEVDKSAHKTLDDESVRLVKLMPKWQPAKNKEEVVRSYFTLPVSFIMISGYCDREAKKAQKIIKRRKN